MKLQEAINDCMEHLSQKELATLLGVTPNQVYKYSIGITKSPGDKVINAFYDNIKIGGESVLLDFYPNEEEYLRIRKLKETVCNPESTK